MSPRAIAAIRRLLARLVAMSRPARADAELDREVRAHLLILEDAFRARGMSDDDAGIAARRAFGSVQLAKERHRDARALRWIDDARRDVGCAIRTLRRAPGFTFVAVATMALGIGAAVAMFSIVDGVLIRPLPYAEPDRLIRVQGVEQVAGTTRLVPVALPVRNLDAWNRATTFDHQAAYDFGVQALIGDQGAEMLDHAVVSPQFFALLGGPFAAGRPLSENDDDAAVAVISERLARRLFGVPADAVGRPLRLASGVYTIVGVAGHAFQFPFKRTDIWLPLGFSLRVQPRTDVRLIARLEPHATVSQANAEFESIAKGHLDHEAQVHGDVQRVAEADVRSARDELVLLFVAVLLLLAVACLNVMNLLLSRNASRAREIAVRHALGASAGRLIAHGAAESVTLAVTGGGAGVVLAYAIVGGIVRVADGIIPRLDGVGLNGRAVGFAVLTTAAVATITSAAPALATVLSRRFPDGRATRRSREGWHGGVRRVLSAAEIAGSFVLVVGAILVGRSLVNLLHEDLGVSADHVVTASMQLAFNYNGRQWTDAETSSRVNHVIEGLRVQPGVRAVGAGSAIPPSMSRITMTLRGGKDGLEFAGALVPVTPGYLAALRMRLVQGRFFTDEDDAGHPPVLIITERTARRLFPNGSPVGQSLRVPSLRDAAGRPRDSQACTVVGVIADVKYAGLAAAPGDVVYRPFAQQPWIAPYLVVRTASDPAAFVPTLRRAIASTDPNIVVSAESTLDAILSGVTAPERYQAIVLVSLTLLALGIAGVGLYGVVAYSVAQRTPELGIRMALGAAPASVRRMVLREGLAIAGIGLAAGIAAGLAFVRLLGALLYGIEPTDVPSFGFAALALGLVALAATYVPARRAARLDPLVALRSE